MTWTKPLRKQQRQFQHQYFKEFILPQQEEQQRERRRYDKITQVSTDRNRELGAKSTNFIPLSDLMKRNHNDRVKYHLANLEGSNGEGGSATGTIEPQNPLSGRTGRGKENLRESSYTDMQIKKPVGGKSMPNRSSKL